MPGLADHLNGLGAEELRAALMSCCGSTRWVHGMVALVPFESDEEVYAAADRIWSGLERDDWLEAFGHHPRIGDRLSEPEGEQERARDWSRGEQSGMSNADAATRQALFDGNRAYEDRFGHVFLICATGRSAEEMAQRLRERLDNDPETELRVAAAEHARITRLRLRKLVTS